MDEVDIHATPHEKSRNDLQSMKATRSIIRCYRPPGLRKSSFHNCCRISCPAVKIVGGLPADEAWHGRFANCDWRVTAGKLSLGVSRGKRFNIGIDRISRRMRIHALASTIHALLAGQNGPGVQQSYGRYRSRAVPRDEPNTATFQHGASCVVGRDRSKHFDSI